LVDAITIKSNWNLALYCCTQSMGRTFWFKKDFWSQRYYWPMG